jgi:hypothetical protein
VERDLPQLGIGIPLASMERFLGMCAHLNGQLLNSSKLGESLGVTHHTVRGYVEAMEKTFLLRVLRPLETNLKKRLVKTPKVYVRDSGMLHALLMLRSHNDLLGHPSYGASWEGFVVENVTAMLPGWKASFYRTRSGAEVDLVLERGQERIAIECKASSSPSPGRGFWRALEDISADKAFVVAPIREPFPIGNGAMAVPLGDLVNTLTSAENAPCVLADACPPSSLPV